MDILTYNNVPLHRRSEYGYAFLLVGTFLPPILRYLLYLEFTGDLYHNKIGKNNALIKWGPLIRLF
jgi:hypothetical protein